jgi:hypothetical protein
LIRRESEVEAAAGLSWQMQCAVFLLTAALVMARRPDLLTHAHFYAEDGAIWYADAYNHGWLHALTQPAGGYLNTLQRLVASLSLLVPLRYAPLLMNICGLTIQVLPVFFLLSSRCAHWWPLRLRLVQAALYIEVPNEREIHIVLTNAPFHLALLAFLVAVAAPPNDWRWKTFDIAVLSISALSGPFCIVILPLVMVFWWLKRERWSLVVMGVLCPLVAVQVAKLFFGGYAGRAPAQLGATPMLFFRLLTGHVYVGSVWGENGFVTHARAAAVLLVMVAGTSVLVYALWRAGLELRLFTVFAMLLLAASLSKPLIGGALPQWQLLAIDRSSRYWFFPMLAVLWSLLFCATQQEDKFFRVAARVMFLALLHGIVHDRRYPPFPDKNFQAFLETYDAAPAGTLVQLPDSPPGLISYLKKK